MMTSEEVLMQSKMAFEQWGPKWDEHAKINGEIMRARGISQKELVNHGIGKQLLCVATGASLEKAMPIIKKYRHKTDIACVDKSFGLLCEHGIVPDFVVIADLNVSFDDWAKKHIDKSENSWLIANVCANPEWIKNWKGPITFYVNKDNIGTQDRYMEISGCREIIPAASNVGNAVIVFFAQVCKYDRYLMAGYDFAWYPGKNYYAYTDNDKRHWMRHVFALGVDGKFCLTSANLNFSARWLVDYIHHSLPNTKIYNCSGEGIVGLRNCSLENKLASWSDRKPTPEEMDAFYMSRTYTDSVPYESPDQLVKALEKYKYIGRVRVDYLRPDIDPAPEVAA